MTKKVLSIATLMFITQIAHSEGQNFLSQDRAAVQKCVDVLIDANSTHIRNGRLLPYWSSVRVNRTSVGDYAVLDIGEGFDRPGQFDSSEICELTQISCLINDEGEVVRLTSPEINNDSLTVVDFIPADQAYEDRIFDELMAAIRSGEEVYSFGSVYRVVGNNLSQVGDTRVVRADPDGYYFD